MRLVDELWSGLQISRALLTPRDNIDKYSCAINERFVTENDIAAMKLKGWVDL